MMPLEQAFQTRSRNLYHAMAGRFKERRWMSGKRQGMVKTPGRDLPFTVDEFRRWFLNQIGGKPEGCGQCSYCNRPIYSENLSPDHMIPVSRGGSLALDNLAACCLECNGAKGALTADEFIHFKGALDSLLQKGHLAPDAYTDIWGRMKGKTAMMLASKALYARKYAKQGPAPPLPEQFRLDEEPF
jgi:hypothetical protein